MGRVHLALVCGFTTMGHPSHSLHPRNCSNPVWAWRLVFDLFGTLPRDRCNSRPFRSVVLHFSYYYRLIRLSYKVTFNCIAVSYAPVLSPPLNVTFCNIFMFLFYIKCAFRRPGSAWTWCDVVKFYCSKPTNFVFKKLWHVARSLAFRRSSHFQNLTSFHFHLI